MDPIGALPSGYSWSIHLLDLGPPMDGADVIGTFQEQLLLFESGNLVRRHGTGSLVDFGSAVNESDLRTAIEVLHGWIKPR